MTRDRLSREDKDALLFRVLELFVSKQLAVDEITKRIKREFKLDLGRTNVYPLLREGVRRQFLRFSPPASDSLRDEFAERFHLDAAHIHVVNVRQDLDDEHVAAVGAEVVLSLVKKLAFTYGRNPVHLGLGPGRATRALASNLGLAMRADPSTPKLALHAITAGCPSRSPMFAPLAFFSFFERDLVAEADALFTEPAVPCSEYDMITTRPGFAKAFAKRDKIDIVVTSLGDAEDDHDLFRNLHEGYEDAEPAADARRTHSAAIRDLERKGWVGNVQFRPYSSRGVIHEAGDSLRAPTLFELEDLRDMASRADDPKRPQAVVLTVQPCGRCGKLRTHALLPLLLVPELRVWSELVVDSATARELLRQPTV
jgi:DNA-binding transcriptional regulator LsrR (DeoR family)